MQDKTSKPFIYERGVRQGCPTSPDLFNIYIDDMLDNLKGIETPGLGYKVKGLHFADDTVIFSNTIEEMKINLEKIEKWCDENCMEINALKSGLMEVSLEGSTSIKNIHLKYKNEIIPHVNEYKYLGVTVTPDLSIEKLAKERIGKGKQILGLWGKTLANGKIGLKYKSMILKNILIPTITYGQEIYGCNENRVKKLKGIIDSALQMIIKKKNFSRYRAYEEFGIKSIGMMAATARARGVRKWIESSRVIGDLARNPV